MNSDFKVYICIDNGSSGTNPLGNVSQDEPTFTDLEPSKAGNSGDFINGNTYLQYLLVILLNLIQQSLLLYQMIGHHLLILKLEQ